MFGFLKRIFGATSAPSHPDPFGREVTPPSAVALPPTPLRTTPPAVLQRDEILDARTRICGYRFAACRPGMADRPDPASTLAVLATSNVAAFADRRLALIPIEQIEWTVHDFQPLIGPNTVFQLASPDAAQWRDVAEAIHAAGASVALSAAGPAIDEFLSSGLVDFLLVDFAQAALANFEPAIKRFKAGCPRLRIIATHVGRWAEYRYCIAHGVDYCIGHFTTTRDEEQVSGEIGQSRLVLIEMLNKLRGESDLVEISETAKRDPGVVVKIIGMANSPMLGLAQQVTSVDQAMMVLGREQLYRWLSIGLFRMAGASPRDEVLLELALARGRFLELIAQGRLAKAACDELFLLGLLSLLDSLLGVPMREVVERINLSPALREVLLSSAGPLGRYLMLAIGVEKGRVDNVARLAEQMDIGLPEIETASVEAIAWAEDAVRLSA